MTCRPPSGFPGVPVNEVELLCLGVVRLEIRVPDDSGSVAARRLRRSGSGVARPWKLGNLMAVTAQELDERVVCEAQRVVHPEPVATAPLCVVELDLLPDAVEEREETVRQTVAHRGDLAALRTME